MAGLKMAALLFMVAIFYPVLAPDSYPEVSASPAYLPVPSSDSNAQVPIMQPISAPPSSPTPSSKAPPTISYPPESISPIIPPSVSPYPPVSPSMPIPLPPAQGIRGAYWPSFNNFPASAVDTSYFTHLYYAFLLLKPTNFELNITQNDVEKIPEFTNALRTKNPPVKTLLSIGGGGSDPKVFSKMASSNLSRAVFIRSTIESARKYGFDGVDLDWEFPANKEDMSNLAVLFKEWRKELNKEAMASGRPRLLLTSAVYFASKFFLSGEPRSYPGESMRNYVDWVSPMCFDYHGSWDNVTGQHSALYDPNSNISTSFGIQSWIDAGLPPSKVVMGLPLYGRTWTLMDPNVNGVGAPAVGVGPGSGVLVYSQVVEFNNVNNSTVKYDTQRVSMYSYAGNSWIGYEDVQSIKMKIQFARSWGLHGYFFWALGQDKDWTISRQASNTWEN